MQLVRRLAPLTPLALASALAAGCSTTTRTVTVGGAPAGLTVTASCAILARFARCDIEHRSWSPPPRPADGHGFFLSIQSYRIF